MHDLRPAGDDDVPSLIDLLQRAFDDDPVIRWLLRDDDRFPTAAREFFELALVRQCLPHGEVRHIAHQATALWAPSDRWQLGILDQLLLAPSIFRIAGWWRVRTALKALDVLEAMHPHQPHMYLAFLATDPDHQGRGLGSSLLRAMAERCSAEGLPMYLENTKPENESFYRHHGFEVIHDIHLGPGAPDYYTGMWWAPPPR